MSMMSEEEKKAIDYLKNDVVYWLDKGKDFVVIDIGENEKLHSILNLIDNQKKEIEEKSTIIMVGAEKVKQLEKEIEEREKYNITTLPFEELKEMIEQNKNISIFGKEYISKDKIREKIKDYDKWIEECTESAYIESLQAQKYALEELLEEITNE